MSVPPSRGASSRIAPRRIIEVKRGLDGGERRFDCELVHRTASRVVVCFRVEEPPWGGEGPLDSYGCFWRSRDYVCYHMVHPSDGRAEVTRFDVVRDVDLSADDEVRYTDLLLDLWVQGGAARWEDDDEVAAALAAGRLDARDAARIDAVRALLERRHRLVTAEVRRLLRALGRLP